MEEIGQLTAVDKMVWTMVEGEVNYPSNIRKGGGAQEWKGSVQRCPVFVNQWSYYINHLFLVTITEALSSQGFRTKGEIGLLVFKNLLKIGMHPCFDCSFCTFTQQDKIAPRQNEEIGYGRCSTKRGLCRAAASQMPDQLIQRTGVSCSEPCARWTYSAGLLHSHPLGLDISPWICPKASQQLCEWKEIWLAWLVMFSYWIFLLWQC